MKNIILNSLLVVFSIVTFTSFSQINELDTLKCNINIVAKTIRDIETISEKEMIQFIKTFDKECANNAEFSEFSNEALFIVIQNKPGLFISTIEKEIDEIDLDAIIIDLENPMNDLIDLQNTLNSIKKAQGNVDLKSQIENALQVAIDKN